MLTYVYGGSNPSLTIFLASSSDDEDRIVKETLLLREGFEPSASVASSNKGGNPKCLQSKHGSLTIFLASSSDDEDRIVKETLLLREGFEPRFCLEVSSPSQRSTEAAKEPPGKTWLLYLQKLSVHIVLIYQGFECFLPPSKPRVG